MQIRLLKISPGEAQPALPARFKADIYATTPVAYGTGPTFKHVDPFEASLLPLLFEGALQGEIPEPIAQLNPQSTPNTFDQAHEKMLHLATQGTISTVLGAQPGPTPASRSSSSIRNCWSSRLHRFSDSSSCTRASSRLLWRVVRPRDFCVLAGFTHSPPVENMQQNTNDLCGLDMNYITYFTYHAVTRLAKTRRPSTANLRLRLKTSSLKRVYSLSLAAWFNDTLFPSTPPKKNIKKCTNSQTKISAKVLSQEATATFRGDVGHKRVKAPGNDAIWSKMVTYQFRDLINYGTFSNNQRHLRSRLCKYSFRKKARKTKSCSEQHLATEMELRDGSAWIPAWSHIVIIFMPSKKWLKRCRKHETHQTSVLFRASNTKSQKLVFNTLARKPTEACRVS